MIRFSHLLFSICIVLAGCSSELPKLEGFDKEVWKNDTKGCKGSRRQYLEPLRSQREKLKGLSEIDLVKVLGKPDENDLSTRHEKFYSFFIDPSPSCGGDSSAYRLIVRFNAVGLSREVAIERMKRE